MFPYTMVEAILLEHQQMVQREIERNRWVQLAGPRPPLGARVVGRMIAAAQDAAAWRRRSGSSRRDHAAHNTRPSLGARTGELGPPVALDLALHHLLMLQEYRLDHGVREHAGLLRTCHM